jgi:DNA-binding response OmpR family regulator
MRLLLAEDDALVARGLIEVFERAGYAVDHVGSGDAAEHALAETAYDLAVLDLGLPGFDGVEVIRRVRRSRSDIPILVLSARAGLDDRVATLDFGADDFLAKPFQVAEVLAHVRALLRRNQPTKAAVLSLGDLRVDLARCVVEHAGQPLALTKREWDIFQLLVLAHPKLLSKRKLVESLGSWDNELTQNAIEIYVSRLRAKLAATGVQVTTVRGIGYGLAIRTA